MNELTEFGRLLRIEYKKRGISQRRLADSIGYTSCYLSAIEHGRRAIPRKVFLKIIKALDADHELATALTLAANITVRSVVIDLPDDLRRIRLATSLAEKVCALPDNTVDEIQQILDRQENKNGHY